MRRSGVIIGKWKWFGCSGLSIVWVDNDAQIGAGILGLRSGWHGKPLGLCYPRSHPPRRTRPGAPILFAEVRVRITGKAGFVRSHP